MLRFFCRQEPELLAISALDEQPKAALVVLDQSPTVDVEDELDLRDGRNRLDLPLQNRTPTPC